jgi:glycosyltransferase involved in cell wall biosynthesis
MYKAMKSVLGDELIALLGRERFDDMQGKGFSSMYLESINRPFVLQRLLERRVDVNADYKYLAGLKRRGVKLAIFYRDGFWAGDLYQKRMPLPWIASEFVKTLYKKDWNFIKKVFDVIYLPSLELAEYMGESSVERYRKLLPGCAINPDYIEPGLKNSKKHNKLKLLYVGGITPPLNDISHMLDNFGGKDGIELVVCTRKAEIVKYKKYYNSFNYRNVRLEADISGDALKRLYHSSDASLLIYPEHAYRKVAMPYKAFEAFGHGLPVIASTGTVFSRLVVDYSLGLVGEGDEFNMLADDPIGTRNQLHNISSYVYDYALNNTWRHRALQVVSDIGVHL